jgi:hypothetical protein
MERKSALIACQESADGQDHVGIEAKGESQWKSKTRLQLEVFILRQVNHKLPWRRDEVRRTR